MPRVWPLRLRRDFAMVVPIIWEQQNRAAQPIMPKGYQRSSVCGEGIAQLLYSRCRWTLVILYKFRVWLVTKLSEFLTLKVECLAFTCHQPMTLRCPLAISPIFTHHRRNDSNDLETINIDWSAILTPGVLKCQKGKNLPFLTLVAIETETYVKCPYFGAKNFVPN